MLGAGDGLIVSEERGRDEMFTSKCRSSEFTRELPGSRFTEKASAGRLRQYKAEFEAGFQGRLFDR